MYKIIKLNYIDIYKKTNTYNKKILLSYTTSQIGFALMIIESELLFCDDSKR